MEEAREIRVSPRDIVASGLCIGCGACVGSESNPSARMAWDSYGQFKPVGSAEWMRSASERFSTSCPFSPASANEDDIAAKRFPDAAVNDRRVGLYEAAWVGHVAEGDFRSRGSSGGLVTWVAAELLREGLVDGVAHVSPADPDLDNGFFRYRISRTMEDVRSGSKSRYYPIELSGVLRDIRETPGRYAVVGVPCFIKAVNLARSRDPVLGERIAFTLGLFCGHMKSARMVESFAWQMGERVEDVSGIDFRLKAPERPANWYTAALSLRDGRSVSRDWFHLVDGDWGSGFFQESACNVCDDVVAETADIAFGDAWVEPYSSDGRGSNVVVRSPLLRDILREAIAQGRLALKPVDTEFVVETQAAGFRQRREGLAYRLTWARSGVTPRKRVFPGARGLKVRRKLIYRVRAMISANSHPVFRLARLIRAPWLFVGWGRICLALYHALAYSRGPLGRVLDRIEAIAERRALPGVGTGTD